MIHVGTGQPNVPFWMDFTISKGVKEALKEDLPIYLKMAVTICEIVDRCLYIGSTHFEIPYNLGTMVLPLKETPRWVNALRITGLVLFTFAAISSLHPVATLSILSSALVIKVIYKEKVVPYLTQTYCNVELVGPLSSRFKK